MRNKAWAIVVVFYLLFYGIILIATKGLPYGIDNNESFSSLWHARNLYSTNFGLTKGLADDVYAWHRAASPYVHTHQGNIPRVFAFLIYLLGARSIESQIVLTTFTVGLAAIWFAFRFLGTVGSLRFAVFGCLILVTDYGLFGQWQVDTYRVWYGFFFFGSLFWVSELGSNPKLWFWLAGALGFAGMFYGEYVFATFAGVMAVTYATYCYRKRLPVLAKASLGVMVGGITAAFVLGAQLVAYMGWKNVKLDIAYTLAARNMASDHAFTTMVDRFYREHRIVFWHNYFDVTNVRSLEAFGRSFIEKHLQFYGTWLILCVIAIACGALLGQIPRGPLQRETQKKLRVLQTLLGHALPGMASIYCSYIIVEGLGPMFGNAVAVSWGDEIGIQPSQWFGWTAYFIAGVLAFAMATAGTSRLVGRENTLFRLLPLSAAVLAGYAVAYRAFTGYVYSGYLDRQAPFLVFWTDVLVAGVVYYVYEIVCRGFREARSRGTVAFLPIAGLVLLACFCGTWISLQAVYFAVVPPNGEPFLKLLAKPPFYGGSFVVNNYPAPEAEQSHAWAYAESSLFSGRIRLGPTGFLVEHDLQYLWFADADENPSYLKPDFGLLLRHPASLGQALEFSHAQKTEPLHSVAFDTTGLIRRTQEPLQGFFEDSLIATDKSTYSIVKFDWDFPPFLQAVDKAMRLAAEKMSFQQRVNFREISYQQRRRWRVEIEPSQDPTAVRPGGASILLMGASIDGLPIFTGEQLAAAGWTYVGGDRTHGGGRWQTFAGRATAVTAVVLGDSVALDFLEGPNRGAATVTVNDLVQTVDFKSSIVRDHLISLDTAHATNRFTAIPYLSPGVYVDTWLHNGRSGPVAVLGYKFAQQEHLEEAGTTVRVYHQRPSGAWDLVDAITFLGADGIPVRIDDFRRENPDTVSEYFRVKVLGDSRTYIQWLTDYLETYGEQRHRAGIVSIEPLPANLAELLDDPIPAYHSIPLLQGLSGQIQISVTPSTRTKTGPEFFGLAFDAAQLQGATNKSFVAVPMDIVGNFGKQDFPYGILKIDLRFPENRPTQAEPLVVAGVEEAADTLYVIYVDSTHIRIGFDHWFKGGPVTPPISIDYKREHELEVSMGSLFPPEDDIVFVGMNPSSLARIKRELRVKLDGRVIIDTPSEFWDSPPSQVAIGRNDVEASTCNRLFNGTIIKCARDWPETQ